MNELAVINKELELKSPILTAMRDRLIPQREAAEKEVSKLGLKADGILQKYNRAVALELAALPTDDKGKLSGEGFDGFKTPVEVAMNLLGFKKQTAYNLVNAGKVYMDDAAPAELKKMTPANMAEFLRADRSEAMKALSTGEVTGATSQADLKAFADAHKPKVTKAGKVKTVTTYTVFRGPTMDKAPGADVTEDEFKASFSEGVTVLYMDKYVLEPHDAPKKHLTVKRFVAVMPDLTAAVFTLIPSYKPDEAEESASEKAYRLADRIIARFMDSHPGASEEDARATLAELGLI